MAVLVKVMRRRSSKIVLDIALFAGFIVEFVTREPDFDPDYVLHSWTGIVLIPVIAFHLAGNWGWITRVSKNGSSDREFSLATLNTALGTLASICIVSGFPLWFEWSTAGWLSTVHTVTGLLAIVVMFIHLAWNRRRIVALVRST